MKRVSIAAWSGLVFVCLLTAGDSACPFCVELTCGFEASEVEVSGPALAKVPEVVRFVLWDDNSHCALTVDPADLTVAPGGDWHVALSYGGECGYELGRGELWGGESADRLEAIGTCASP